MSYETNASSSSFTQQNTTSDDFSLLRQDLMADDEKRLRDQGEDSEDYDDTYIDMFGNHKRKDNRIGQNFQATSIPLITDITYFEALRELDTANAQKCNLTWQPEKLPPEKVGKYTQHSLSVIDYYLSNMQLLWPYQYFHYQEEVALQFLHLKKYDIELALSTVLYDMDQLVQLLLVTRRKRRTQGMLTAILMKQ